MSCFLVGKVIKQTAGFHVLRVSRQKLGSLHWIVFFIPFIGLDWIFPLQFLQKLQVRSTTAKVVPSSSYQSLLLSWLISGAQSISKYPHSSLHLLIPSPVKLHNSLPKCGKYFRKYANKMSCSLCTFPACPPVPCPTDDCGQNFCCQDHLKRWEGPQVN